MDVGWPSRRRIGTRGQQIRRTTSPHHRVRIPLLLCPLLLLLFLILVGAAAGQHQEVPVGRPGTVSVLEGFVVDRLSADRGVATSGRHLLLYPEDHSLWSVASEAAVHGGYCLLVPTTPADRQAIAADAAASGANYVPLWHCGYNFSVIASVVLRDKLLLLHSLDLATDGRGLVDPEPVTPLTATTTMPDATATAALTEGGDGSTRPQPSPQIRRTTTTAAAASTAFLGTDSVRLLHQRPWTWNASCNLRVSVAGLWLTPTHFMPSPVDHADVVTRLVADEASPSASSVVVAAVASEGAASSTTSSSTSPSMVAPLTTPGPSGGVYVVSKQQLLARLGRTQWSPSRHSSVAVTVAMPTLLLLSLSSILTC